MDNKALVVTLVVVFIGGLVLGSASFGGFSGRAVTGTPTISASPSVISPGGFVTFYINPQGYDCKLYVYKTNQYGQESRVDSLEYSRGEGRSCTTPVNYRYAVPLYFEGQYVVRVFEDQTGSGNYVQAAFNVA